MLCPFSQVCVWLWPGGDLEGRDFHDSSPTFAATDSTDGSFQRLVSSFRWQGNMILVGGGLRDCRPCCVKSIGKKNPSSFIPSGRLAIKCSQPIIDRWLSGGGSLGPTMRHVNAPSKKPTCHTLHLLLRPEQGKPCTQSALPGKLRSRRLKKQTNRMLSSIKALASSRPEAQSV